MTPLSDALPKGYWENFQRLIEQEAYRDAEWHEWHLWIFLSETVRYWPEHLLRPIVMALGRNS